MISFKTFGFCVLQTALVCGADIQQQTPPSFSYTENITLPENIASTTVILRITGKQLLSQIDKVESLIQAAKAQQKVLTLAVDVTKGDGLVDEHGRLRMHRDNLPVSLTSLIIQNTAQDVTSTAGYFLYDRTGLTSVDFSGLTSLTHVERSFLRNCTGLTSVDFTGVSNITHVGMGFISDCHNITNFIVSDTTSKELIRRAADTLRQSKYHNQRVLGFKLYRRYLYELPADLQAEAIEWNLPLVQTMTPKPLADLPKMSKEFVLSIFEQGISTLDLEMRDQSIKLMEIIRFCFGDTTTKWPWHRPFHGEKAAPYAFKHIANALQNLLKTKKGQLEAKVYLSKLIDASLNYKSYQAMIFYQNFMAMSINQSLMHLEPTRLTVANITSCNRIWSLINISKLRAFQNFAPVSTQLSDYIDRFAVVSLHIGLPVAAHQFELDHPGLSARKIDVLLRDFLLNYWTPEILIDHLRGEIEKANTTEEARQDPNNELSYQNLRTFYWNHLAEDKKIGVDQEDFMRQAADKRDGLNLIQFIRSLFWFTEWDSKTQPLSRYEIRLILEGLGVLQQTN